MFGGNGFRFSEFGWGAAAPSCYFFAEGAKGLGFAVLFFDIATKWH